MMTPDSSFQPFGCDDPFAELIRLNMPSEGSRMTIHSVAPAWGHYLLLS